MYRRFWSRCKLLNVTVICTKIILYSFLLRLFQPQWAGQDEQGPLLMKPLSGAEVADLAAGPGADLNGGEHSEHPSPGEP